MCFAVRRLDSVRVGLMDTAEVSKVILRAGGFIFLQLTACCLSSACLHHGTIKKVAEPCALQELQANQLFEIVVAE